MRLAIWHQYLSKSYYALGDINSSWLHAILSLQKIGKNADLRQSRTWLYDCTNIRVFAGLYRCLNLGWTYMQNAEDVSVGTTFYCETLSHLASLAIIRVRALKIPSFIPRGWYTMYISK